jgi:hypothetical protein
VTAIPLGPFTTGTVVTTALPGLAITETPVVQVARYQLGSDAILIGTTR